MHLSAGIHLFSNGTVAKDLFSLIIVIQHEISKRLVNLQTSCGCCKIISLVWIGKGSSGKLLQIHTTAGRLANK